MNKHDAVVLPSRLRVVLHLMLCKGNSLSTTASLNASGTKWYVDDGPHLEKNTRAYFS